MPEAQTSTRGKITEATISWPLGGLRKTGPMSRRPINAQQRRVLQWIADGCPDGLTDGLTDVSSYEVTAVALQSRGLAVVSRPRGGVWRATRTADGAYFLASGAYPSAKRQAVLDVPRQPSIHSRHRRRPPLVRRDSRPSVGRPDQPLKR
jgi:hypothetical protein